MNTYSGLFVTTIGLHLLYEASQPIWDMVILVSKYKIGHAHAGGTGYIRLSDDVCIEP